MGGAAGIQRVTRSSQLPLSFAQERIWLHEQLNPGSVVHNRPVHIRLRGRLNVDALRQSLEQIIQRHEVLRTTVSVEKSLARQQINEEFTLELSISDVSDTSDADARAAELAIEHPCQLLDLTTGPLVRTGLVRTAEEDHLLLLAFHHFAFDAWSETILIRELAANYEVFDTGQTPCQDELAIQFADYAVWERQATVRGAFR